MMHLKQVVSFSVVVMVTFVVAFVPGVYGAEEVTLKEQLEIQRQQLEIQKQQLEIQKQQLNQQAAQLEQQNRRIDKLSQRVSGGQPDVAKVPTNKPDVSQPIDQPVASQPIDQPVASESIDKTTALQIRDTVGDLRSPSIRQGEFPGAIELVGRHDIPISLAIGGFVKTVAFYDTDYERDDSYFFPALLGLGSEDEDGQFGMSSELSRVYFDARTNTGKGQLRSYIEFDFRDDFTLRHAYLDWSGKHGALKVGQYWSTFMDLHALAEGVTEPLVSGAVLARQEQIRYTFPSKNGMTFAIAVEDPSSNDVLTDKQPLAHTPDIISTLKIDLPNRSHIRFGALARRIELKNDNLADNKTTGWGVQTSGRWNLTEVDSLVAGIAYGDGIGRYLLGLDPFSGAYIDSDSNNLSSRTGKGGFISYTRRFNDDLRASLMYGEAHAEDENILLGTAFDNSKYFGANMFYVLTPYLTLGLEYSWGERENLDGSDLDNHRVTLGLQLF